MHTRDLNRKYIHFRWYIDFRPNRYVLIFACLFALLKVDAQTPDSLKTEKQTMPEDRFPSKRPLRVQYESFAKRNFTSKLFDQQFQQGKLKSDRRISVEATIPIFIRPRYIVTASVKYSNQDMQLSNVVISPYNNNFQQSSHRNFNYFSTTAGFVYFSTLFNRRVIYNANLVTDGNQNGLKRVYGTATAILILKTSRNINISVGLIGFFDPAAFIPVVPSVAVQLRIRNSDWRIDLLMPRHILLKRPLFHSAQLSLGSELSSNLFYVKPAGVAAAGTYQFSQLESKTGATFEQKINKQFIFSIRAGYQHIFNAKLSPKNKPVSDYVYQAKSDATGYCSIGFSYIPFRKK